jgi:hypothetical protein
VHHAATLTTDYVEAMGAAEHCDTAVLDVQLCAIRKLLEAGPEAAAEARDVVRQLEAVVRQKIARRRAA